MKYQQDVNRSKLLAQTAKIVAARLSNNTLSLAELPAFIEGVFGKLAALAAGDGAPEPVELVPAVPIRRSVTGDHIVCLEDGKKLKTLKRHLMSDHGLTPEAYRAKWGLKPDYPMVAPNYAARRQELAKQFGLGRKPTPPTPPKPKRRRKTVP